MKPKVFEQIELKAPIDSPTFTGLPNSTTPGTTSNDTRIATTEFVNDLNPLTIKTTSESDLNNIIENGIYILTNPLSNLPSTTNIAKKSPLIVLNANGCITQLMYCRGNNNIRTRVGTSWAAWYKFTIGPSSIYVQKSGATMTGELIAANNANYTTAQVRNITISQDEPSGGGNGDIWLRYE